MSSLVGKAYRFTEELVKQHRDKLKLVRKLDFWVIILNTEKNSVSVIRSHAYKYSTCTTEINIWFDV